MVLPLFTDVVNKEVEKPCWPEHPYGPNEVKVSTGYSVGLIFFCLNFNVYAEMPLFLLFQDFLLFGDLNMRI